MGIIRDYGEHTHKRPMHNINISPVIDDHVAFNDTMLQGVVGGLLGSAFCCGACFMFTFMRDPANPCDMSPLISVKHLLRLKLNEGQGH